MEIKVLVEGSQGESHESEFENLFDAMDDARILLDFGYVVTIIINGCYFRVIRDSGIIRSVPIGQGP